MAAELGIELGSITGSGRSGLITKDDVTSAAESRSLRVAEKEIGTTAGDKIVATHVPGVWSGIWVSIGEHSMARVETAGFARPTYSKQA